MRERRRSHREDAYAVAGFGPSGRRMTLTRAFVASATLAALLGGCARQPTSSSPRPAPTNVVRHAGAMRDAMWQGRIGPRFSVDSLAGGPGGYAIGPAAGLRGEILVLDGAPYVSRIADDGRVRVAREVDVRAPFLVYARVTGWREVALPDSVREEAALERFFGTVVEAGAQPAAFRLEGVLAKADLHVQNLPPGTTVSSPREAHAGQVGFTVADAAGTVLGFYSTSHQGVFTHHDTNVHLHFVADDASTLGHVDGLSFDPAAVRLWIAVGA